MIKHALLLLSSIILLSSTTLKKNTYQVGDEVKDFKLKNIDDNIVSLADFKSAKGYILIFTCNHCPYAKAYEDRIIKLHQQYENTYPVIAINPNDAVEYPEDSFEKMKARAKEKGFNFVYLHDETQQIARDFGATKTPHVYLIKKENNKNIIKYIGAIDNNYQDEKAATEHYVQDAIQSLEKKETIKIKETKAIGCSIKWKK